MRFEDTSYEHQLAVCLNGPSYMHIWPNLNWTLTDYQEFVEDIGRGRIYQDACSRWFVINPNFVEE